jgi:YHS domain-containing protein
MILKLVIGIIVIYLLTKLIRMGFPAVGGKHGPAKIRTPGAGEELVEDPHCHAYVPVSQAFRMEIDGKTVYFCSQKCLDQYEKNQTGIRGDSPR